MSNAVAINGAVSLAISATIIGAFGGPILALAGTRGFKKASIYFENKEKAFPDDFWKTTACKIAKCAMQISAFAAASIGTLAFTLAAFAGQIVLFPSSILAPTLVILSSFTLGCEAQRQAFSAA